MVKFNKKKIFIGFLIVFFLIPIVNFCSMSDEDLQKYKQERFQKNYNRFKIDSIKNVKENPELAAINAEVELKKILNDPSSYQRDNIDSYYDETLHGYICEIQYRAKNGFGGTMRYTTKFLIYINPKFNKDTGETEIYYKSVLLK